MLTTPKEKFKTQSVAIKEAKDVAPGTMDNSLADFLFSAGKDPIFGFYSGKIEILGDIVAPLYTDEELEEFVRQKAERLS